ncbi:MAG: GspH/FimT family pseudopilin [Thiotrichales bacterium]
MKNKNRGFNVIELIVTLGIASTLMSLAIPSYRWMVQNNRVVATTNTLVTAIQMARSEAIKQGVELQLVARDGDWNAGWDIGIDLDGDGSFDGDGESILQGWDGPGDGLALSMAANRVSIRANGRARDAAAFVVTPHECTSGQNLQRQVNVATSGQVATVAVACP